MKHIFDVISAVVTLFDDHPVGTSLLIRAIRTFFTMVLDWRADHRSLRRKGRREPSRRAGKGQV